MWLAHATLSFALLVPQTPPAAEDRAGPTQAEVERACKQLDAALASGADPEKARAALEAALEVVHADVIERIESRGLRHAEAPIRDAAVEALARMDHPDALAALHGALKRDKKELAEAPPRYAILLRAIARHGETASIPLLVEDLFQSPDRNVITARILGLGNIRARASVDELIQMMRSGPRPRVAEHMADFRTALVVLTGADKGTDQGLWLNWYGDNKTTLAIAPEPPEELPREIRRRWQQFWGPERRGEKGKPGRPRREK